VLITESVTKKRIFAKKKEEKEAAFIVR